jgi:hypothetical protein
VTPGTPGIDAADVMAVQRFAGRFISRPPRCPFAAAHVGDTGIITVIDVIAVQRFTLGLTTGIAGTGNYHFNPPTRTYEAVITNQTGQNYDTLVLGDVVAPFLYGPEGPSQPAVSDNTILSPVTTVALPQIAPDHPGTDFTAPVTTSTIDPRKNLVGFQGDFTFDERMVTFQSEPVRKAGLTAGNWNVSGNVLDGIGPIRTLRVSAYSNDFVPLSGSGALFELRMTRVSKAAQRTQLIWAAPPNEFIFIDAELNTQKPGYAGSGSITQSGKRK